MGLCNAATIHQRRVTAASHRQLGRICHIYLDDIVIWSDTIQQHWEHVCEILEVLRRAKLYCNPNKYQFFLLELDFLGHHISESGV